MPETAEKKKAIHKTGKQETDIAGLSAMMHASIKGEVRFDNGSRGAYATDGSNYRQVPMGVVLPLDEEEIINTVRICRQFQAPLVAACLVAGLAITAALLKNGDQ